MLLSSGKEVCLWNLDKFELVKEYPLVNRLKKRSSINYLSVRNDSNYKHQCVLFCFCSIF